MILFKQASSLTNYLLQQKNKSGKTGFVPTMGALHAGHLSLVTASKQQNDITVCSIFVNPTQFNNADDFAKYPVTLENDIEQLLAAGCDALFLPSKDEIYPPGYRAKSYDLGVLETVLEGRYRPGHFQGVCQVVDRLLEMVNPDNLYLGQKDYQQCMVIETLIKSLHKQDSIHLNIRPTQREDDGLAMSSRNLRLTQAQRQAAPAIYRSLLRAKEELLATETEKIEKDATAYLTDRGFAVDYFAIADAETLLPAGKKNGPLVALVAAHLDNIRLIDNLRLN